MPGAIIRRSRSSRVGPATKPISATAGINKFTRISKRSNVGKDVVEKIVAEKIAETAIEVTTPTVAPAAPPVAAPSKKRKAEDESSEQPQTTRAGKRSCRQPLGSVPEAHQQLPRTPTQTKPQSSRPGVDLTAAQQAGALFERLNLQSPSSTRTWRADSTPFPQELTDLINLQGAFLKTVSIHYAHNGSNVPIDVKMVCPGIAQAWGKRRVTLDDVCRCIGVMGAESPFYVSDYGRGKVCLELHRPGVHAGPLPEERLNRVFEEQLRRAWAARSSSDARQFVAGLPRALVKKSAASLAKPPALAKGQRTLEELKHGIALKKQEKEAKEEAKKAASSSSSSSSSTSPAALNPDGTKMSLLDRIRLRQLQQSQLEATGPSAAELERRAALQRADDVAAVVTMLSRATAVGQKRVSFTMGAVLTKLKDSLRLPISREEGAACVRTLAREIAPEWLKIVTIGNRENVVVLTEFTPSKATIQERVQKVGC
ncbi:uncharacterized protein E0L32_000009 [Thyridium curvatum]|uniref:DNA replication factor Cdt1 C-terminal domain-containing protein n=1 Tax=Thyridium curvatum TaxID=1093900 RepID=A0A507AY19_9PEZI|nr:uncharacterized protein E0L32_000009 [Thyridium curvatum]TPX15675.1 hypothetical protein E0L32_000009 [Thyridium curvatum]